MPELFLVNKASAEELEDFEPEQVQPDAYTLTGDQRADLEKAFRAMAFIVDWLIQAGPEELRRCADILRDETPEAKR